MRIIAHRGGPKRAEENTLSAFQRALDDGADGFECDVVLTKDGEPVVFHKPFYSDSISKITHHKGRLKDLDWRTLKEITTKNGESIPHLKDTLEFIASQPSLVECFIEPKIVSQEVVDKIVDAVSLYDVEDKVRVITFSNRKKLLCKSKHRNPKIKTSVILVSPFGDWRRKANAACADIVVPGWKYLNTVRLFAALFVDLKKKVEHARKQNLRVYSGIADNERNLRWLCDLGVHGIFTDDVPLARKVISDYRCHDNAVRHS